MADKSDKPLDQHPLVAKVRSTPTEPPEEVIELIGFPGNSDRVGYQRLYLTPALDTYAEFALSDMKYSTQVPADSSPFLGHEVVVVSILRDATVEYTWTTQADRRDEFDLDVQLEVARPRAWGPMARIYSVPQCVTRAPYCETDGCELNQ
jgi:hypothetical protein